MSRSGKESEDEINVKSGRKYRSHTQLTSVDSPLRRSTRNRANNKQNETSPDSPLSDASSVNNTQPTRITRQRGLAADGAAVHESHRTLRSRMNSMSSDVSEVTEIDIATPKKRTSSITSSDTTNITNNRRSKRFMRAGSEVNSPLTTRSLRSTRATSVECDSNIGIKATDRFNNEVTGTPIRTRRRTSVLPSEATVIEEQERNLKIPMVTLDRALPSLNKIKESESQKSHSYSKDIDDTSNNSIDEKNDEDNNSVKGPYNSEPGIVSTNRFEDVLKNTSLYDENASCNENSRLENEKKLSIYTTKEVKSPEHTESKIFGHNESKHTCNEVDLEHGDLLNKSLDNHGDNSNEENLTENIVDDSRNSDDTTSNVSSQSRELVFLNSRNVNNLTNEIRESPLTEVGNKIKAPHNSAMEKMDISITEEDDLRNVSRVSTDVEVQLIDDTVPNQNIDNDISVKTVCVEYVKDDKSDNHMDTQLSPELDESNEKKSNDERMQINVSVPEECKHEVVEVEKNDVIENSIKENDSHGKEENVDSNEPGVIKEKENEINAVDKHSVTSVSITVDLSQPVDVTLGTDNEKPASEEMCSSQNTDETHNLNSSTRTVLELSAASARSKDSTFSKSDEDNVTNVIKSSQSSIVADIPGESVEEAPEREEQSEKVPKLDNSLSSRKQRVDKVESNKKDSNLNAESVKVHDDDSDSNAEILFQDIPASEWKTKEPETGKNNAASVSMEGLEYEKEAECELVLVDKEAWSSAENMRTQRKQEIRMIDYDSDDTVVLKSKAGSPKASSKLAENNVSEDEENQFNASKSRFSSLKKRGSMTQAGKVDKNECRSIENEEDIEIDIDEVENVNKNNSLVKDNRRRSISRRRSSFRKSLEEKSLSESHEDAGEKTNTSLNKSKLSENTPIKRKSLSESIQETNESHELNKITKWGTPSNKSDVNENEKSESKRSCDKVRSTSAKKSGGNTNLNSSMKKKLNPHRLNASSTDESEEREFQDNRDRNYSIVATLGSNSDESENNSESEDSRNKTIKLPKFLFGGSSRSNSESQNESDQSMNSDIEREYNLHGRSISKFSDDDVPGDICRASESEYSDSDDNGSDLADFVVNDDEVEEEVEENESDDENSKDTDEANKNEELSNTEAEEEQGDDDIKIQENSNTNNKKEKVKKNIQIDEEVTNDTIKDLKRKSMNTSSKEMNKSRKSDNLNLSQSCTSDKKKKNKTVAWEADDIANISPSVFETSKKAKKRASDEFTGEGIAQLFNESQLMNKNLQLLNRSIECSTPKIGTSKREKVNISIQMANTSENLNNETSQIKDDSSDVEQDKNVILKDYSSKKKLNKIKSAESFMHNSLPSQLIELTAKTNLSRTMSSKVVELNKTMFNVENDSPTTKYLRKSKLNESAPILKLGSELQDVIADNKEQNSQFANNNEDDNEQSSEEPKDVGNPLKKKLFEVANSILGNDQRKKPKRRKQFTMEVNEALVKDVENENLVTKNDNAISDPSMNNNIDTVSSDKKKKKKKKKKVEIDVAAKEAVEEIPETKTLISDGKVTNEGKKKKKKRKVAEVMPDLEIANDEPKIVKKKKTALISSTNEDVLEEKELPKKKQKKRDLLSGNSVPQNNEEFGIKLSKKKKSSHTDVVQQDEVADKKVAKKKKELLLDTSQDENIVMEKVPKQKQKLLESEKSNVKRSKSRGLDNVANLYGETETAASSKVGDKALKVSQHLVHSNELDKEMKKKKQKERMEAIQEQEETKIKKSKSNTQAIKTNKASAEGKSIKRLSEDFLESLADIPMKPTKRRKIAKAEDQSSMLGWTVTTNGPTENYIVGPSNSGSTTTFIISDIRQMKKKKKTSDTLSFKQRMMVRKSRQPVSAYLMYLEKQNASGKDKFCSRPY